MSNSNILLVVENIDIAKNIIGAIDGNYTCLLSTNSVEALSLYESSNPEVIIFSHSTVEESKSIYFEILKKTNISATKQHEAILMCKQNNLQHAYDLCKQNMFYDYLINEPDNDLIHINIIIRKIITSFSDEGMSIKAREFARETRGLDELNADIQNLINKEDKVKEITDKTMHELSERMKNDVALMSERIKKKVYGVKENDELIGIIDKEVKEFSSNELEKDIDSSQSQIDKIVSRWGGELRQVQSKHSPKISKISNLSSSIKKMILVVEDNEVYGEMISDIIVGTGKYDSKIKTSVHHGLTSMVCDRPDMVFLDYELPDATAADFLDKVSQISTIQDIPVVMLTSHTSKDIVNTVLTQGAVDFIVKPASKKIIIEKLIKWNK